MKAKWLGLVVTFLMGSSAVAAPIPPEEVLGEETYAALSACIPVEVAIDIKPGSDPNSINPKSHGVVPVAILGSDIFDVQDVDPWSLVFAGSGPKEKGKSGRVCSYEDVNCDGFLDLMAHFPVQNLDLSFGMTEAILTGVQTDGTCLTGTDTVRIIPEPAAVVLLAGGAMGLILRRRRA
jgi:hypothetical protein